jgi:hypothetical protein
MNFVKREIALAAALAALVLAAARGAAQPPVTLRSASAGPGSLTQPPVVASYTLRARLDADEHTVDGSGTLRWRNPARRPVDELCFHLYLNAFRNSASSWLRHGSREPVETLSPDGWGWIELASLEADGINLLGDLRYVSPDDGNPDDRTVARVPLPRPVAPGETVEISLAWTSRLPRAVARTGYRGDYHLVGQWFPKLGVMQEDGDWSCHQFHRSSEFYADFGNYDVTLSVPQRFVVGATGRRVSEHDEDGVKTLRYVQDGVHDFAWTAWPDFVEGRRTFRHPELPEVEVRLLMAPETARFAGRYGAAVLAALRTFGEWYGPYPYSTLTLVDPPWGAGATGGMEYPTFITTGSRWLSPFPTQDPEGVTVHEFGHQFFYGLLASDEVQESWLDEGVNSYATARVMDAVYGPETWSFRTWGIPWVFRGVVKEHPLDTQARYFQDPEIDPVTRTTWGYLDRTSLRYQTYSKTALTLAQLERLVGAPAMRRAMRDYTAEWRFRHPSTEDFVRSLSRSLGRDLTPYFAQTLGSAAVLDYAVDEVSTRPRRGAVGVFGDGDERQVTASGEALPGWQSEVVVRRLGGVRLPVVTELTFEGGERARVRWDGEERWVRFRVTGPRLLSAQVDPDRTLLLDVDRLNDSRRVEPDRRASRRWGQRLRFWIQNLFETLALLS